MNDIYKQLTGIDISEQISEWDDRGKGYYGEYLLFSEIYRKFPGCCKILMNLQIPSEHGKTTEIDLLLIHETGLYVFEVKYYKGTIYGKMDDAQWTQYFRTVKNNCFPNPIYQNQWHIKQLNRLVPELPIHSFIVFTNEQCDLKITGNASNTTLCNISSMHTRFRTVSRQSEFKLEIDEIDNIFNLLKVYSPMQEVDVIYKDDKNINFYQFVEMLDNFHTTRREDLERGYVTKAQLLEQNYIAKENENKKKAKKVQRRTKTLCVAIILFFFILTSNITSSYQLQMKNAISNADAAQRELNEFKKKWEVITDFEIDGEKLKENYVTVDHVNLTNSADFGDTVYLSFTITHNGEDFYVLIDKSSMFNIVLKDGRVIETPCYNSPYYSYSLGYSQKSKTLEVKKVEFTGFSAEQVSFVKLTHLQIKRIKYVYNENPMLTDYEIVLYESNDFGEN